MLRTKQQNKALHLWFNLVAEELNDKGYEQKITFGTKDCPWAKESVKAIFKKIAKFQVEEFKTSKLTTKQLKLVEETLHRILAEEGIHVEFPSIEQVYEETISLRR